MVECPFCGASGDRVLYEGIKRKRYKCLDCHKSFKHGKTVMSKDDIFRVMALMMRRTAGISITRDSSLDDEKFRESDRVKEK